MTERPRHASELRLRTPGRRIALARGMELAIRPIRPSDKELLATGLKRLSRQTIERRFHAPKPRFSGTELRYLTEVDGENHVALVSELPGTENDALVGVARFVRLVDDPETAEVAVVVADPYQRRGVGTQLILALADEARALGVRRFAATMQSDNVAAMRLMTTLSARVTREQSGSATSLVAELDPAADLAA